MIYVVINTTMSSSNTLTYFGVDSLLASSASSSDFKQVYNPSGKTVMCREKQCLHCSDSTHGVTACGNERLSAEHPLRHFSDAISRQGAFVHSGDGFRCLTSSVDFVILGYCLFLF